MEKQQLRTVYKDIRKSINDKPRLSKVICRLATDYIETHKFNCISCYFPLANEVDTREIIDYCFQNKMNVYIPCISSDTEMEMIKLTAFSELEISQFGLYQVKREFQSQNSRLLNLEDLQVTFTPLLSFDKNKNRLGYGKGHYDKFFTKCLPRVIKIGLAFSRQQAVHIPAEKHDITLDIIITEDGLLSDNPLSPTP